MRNTTMRFAALAVAVSAFGFAQAQTFDFESVPDSGGHSAGGYTSLSMTSGSQTLVITRPSLAAFDVTDMSPGTPASWGHRTLSPFFSTGGGPFMLNFSIGISSFHVEVGDFLPSDDDTAYFSAYTGASGTGTLLGTFSATLPGSGSGFLYTSLSGGGSPAAMSIVMGGGSSTFPDSLFWDNIHVTSVPEPASIAGFGLAGLMLLARRKK